MKNKRGLVLLIISAGFLALVITAGVWNKRTNATGMAASYEELLLVMQTDFEDYNIHIWKNEENAYYFLLPAAVDLNSVCFGNVGKNTQLFLDGEEVDGNTDLAALISYGDPCELQMTVEQVQLEPVEVVFFHSENIASMFLKMESDDFSAIQSDKELKVEADVSLIAADGSLEYSDRLDYIKARGNSTFYETDKKSFQLKLRRDSSLLDMGDADKWILMAQAFDGSFMRNELVNSFAEENTNVLSQSGEYLDLYINGEYYGLYYLCEKVEVGENRVDIFDLESVNATLNGTAVSETENQYISEDGKIRSTVNTKNPADITGGYLLELIREEEYEQTQCAFQTDSGKCYGIVSPQNATREQVEYICGLFDEMENAFAQEDGVCTDTGKHYSEYLDVASWVEKYVLEEVFHDPDGSWASSFFYKDSDSVDPLIHAGPMWDYDRAMGSYAVTGCYRLDNPRQIIYGSAYASSWIQRPEIRDMVTEAFCTIFSDKNVAQLIAETYEVEDKIRAAVLMDDVRWNWTRRYYENLDANREYIIYFLQNKIEYLKDVWMEDAVYHTVTFLDYEGNVWEQYYVKHGDFLVEKPDVHSYLGLFAGWYSQETGQKLEMQLPVLENVTYRSEWVELNHVIANDLAVYGIDLQEVDIDELQAFVDAVKRMQEAE